MTRSRSNELYLAAAVFFLLVGTWLAFQVIGILIRLALLVAVVVLAIAAYRAWADGR